MDSSVSLYNNVKDYIIIDERGRKGFCTGVIKDALWLHFLKVLYVYYVAFCLLVCLHIFLNSCAVANIK